MRSLSVLCAVAAASWASFAAAGSDFVLLETFQGEDALSGWAMSSKEKYARQPVSVSDPKINGFPDEKTLILELPHRYYGLAKSFATPLDVGDKPFVLQYEVKLDEPLTCGGAYLKVFQDGATSDPADFDNETPYIVMFGPDRCGATNKVHFILRHQNPVTGKWEEKHAKNVPAIKTDKKSHVYMLVIRPDNSWDILIDGKSEAKGSLLETMEPPVNPPEYIDDPTDSKPADWVDEAKIPDPDARKPEDWDESAPATIPDMDATKPEGWLDDEHDMVADPEATQPEDWDQEQDGDWEAPQIANPKCDDAPGCGEWQRPNKPNPAYKGKWNAPLIDNPAYKGEWKPRQIKNPDYFVDEHPARLPKMSAVAVEVWTTNGGIRMDNFLVGHDEAAALNYAKTTWKKKYDSELAAEEAAIKETKSKEQEAKKAQGGWRNLAEVYSQQVMEAAAEKPVAAAGTLGALVLTLLYLILGRRGPAPAESTKDQPEGTKDEAEEDDKGASGGDEITESKEATGGEDDNDADDADD